MSERFFGLIMKDKKRGYTKMVDHFRSMPSPRAFLTLRNLKENKLAWTDNFDSLISDMLAGL
ncbi:MAG: hypothetical protein DRI97_00685 [Bacteroidetes bacterium]|nr:MAG: hypothetical protein DRI97_00685 [Bacteroidota bacterium]